MTSEGEEWTCAAVARDGLLESRPASASVRVGPRIKDIMTWLARHTGGWCADRSKKMVNLCGDVMLCSDPTIMRTYPSGLALDVGFHWAGAGGAILEAGGDCEGERLSLHVDEAGRISLAAMQEGGRSCARSPRDEPGPARRSSAVESHHRFVL